MIKIYPKIEFAATSPYGDAVLAPRKILWQGMHTCVEAECPLTKKHVVATLPSGHGTLNSYIVNPTTKEIFCYPNVRRWFGEPLLHSLTHPQSDEVEMKVEKFRPVKKVIILNTIDYLYGHSLLKLLNAERHLVNNRKLGLVVIVQDFLRWMVPEGVAEVWSVRVPLSTAQNYFPSLDQKIAKECKRFSHIYLSKAHSHPQVLDIFRFSKIKPHDDAVEPFRITFIWRNDRPWFSHRYVIAAGKEMGMMVLFQQLQNRKIVSLFNRIRKKLPNVRYTVAGAGTATRFPSWIDDKRIDIFSAKVEQNLCTVYSESRIVIGVHGSNMLLPSAHADITIDLMPKERWGNFAQDIIFQETDVRRAAFRYRFVPIQISTSILAHLITTQLSEYEQFSTQMRK
ncbi:MAG: hypothetical protein PHP42_02390 [Bacteroidota bacterium]|nr:hypothetical protein [Bacteroidota bacterium]